MRYKMRTSYGTEILFSDYNKAIKIAKNHSIVGCTVTVEDLYNHTIVYLDRE